MIKDFSTDQNPLLKKICGLTIRLSKVSLREAWVTGLFAGVQVQGGNGQVIVPSGCGKDHTFTVRDFPLKSYACECGKRHCWVVTWID